MLAKELEALLPLAGLVEDGRVVEQDLRVLVLALGDLAKHLLVAGHRAVRLGKLAVEVLGDGEADPVAAQARGGLEDRRASVDVGRVMAQVDRQDRKVAEDVERVLRRAVGKRRRGVSAAPRARTADGRRTFSILFACE